MANSNGYITAPISLHADVYPVLGIAPSGSYYDVAEACTSGKINKWSRNKPMIPITDTQTALTDTQKKNARYGINVPNSFYGHNAFDSHLWEYNQPQLGTNWMRLTDFENYYHYAINPISTIIFPTSIKIVANSTSGVDLQFTLGLASPAQSPYSLTLNDLFLDATGENALYPTVVLWDGGINYYVKSASKTIQELFESGVYGTGIIINSSDLPFKVGDNIQMVMVLQAGDKSSGESNGSTYFTCWSLETEEGIDKSTVTITQVYWYTGLNITTTASVTQTTASTSRTFKVNSVTVTADVTSDWIRGTFDVELSGIVSASTGSTGLKTLGTLTFYSSDFATSGNDSVAKTLTSVQNTTFTISTSGMIGTGAFQISPKAVTSTDSIGKTYSNYTITFTA